MKLSLLLALQLSAVIVTVLSLEPVSIEEVDLNREGNTLDENALKNSGFSGASFGFNWNSEDSDSTKYRPQGVATFSSGSNEYAVVSWYGREQENYDNRGVRIALVDITNSSASEVKYRHILLVDKDYHPFEGMHGGGLAYSVTDQSIHVPDSRSGTKKVYTFPLSNIMYVPESERDQYYNYVYVLVKGGGYQVPITPSFLSYDWDAEKFLVGTFWQCSSSHKDSADCMASEKNRLAWFSPDTVDSSTASCAPFFSELQGAAVASVPSVDGASRVLWTSSSYGSSHGSHLHISDISLLDCNAGDYKWDNEKYRVVDYPPGLEDLHVSDPGMETPQFLWAVTEFGTNDGSGNMRTVFKTDIQNLLL